MRIAQVVRSDAFAGVERYICGVATELASRGHEVSAVGGDPSRMPSELGDSVSYVPAKTTPDVLRVVARLRDHDLVHVHMTAAELGVLGARLFNRVPIIATRHFPDQRLGRAPRAAARFIRSRLSQQIAISDFVAARIGEPSIVIHNGVPLRAQADLEEPTALMLQRLQPEKAPAVGLEAWARSGLAERGWSLIIAGGGSLEGDLRKRARDQGIESSVSFAGHVSSTDDLLRRTSMLLAPAPAEPFGLSVVEAMAHGVPVIAARGGAHPETLGEGGLFFDPGDVDEAAELLVTTACDRELRLRIGRQLRERQASLFSLQRHVDKLETLYASHVERERISA